MKFGSVCSGIESASVAWHPLGWKASFFSEIEKFPCAVLAHHYPHVPNLGDMTKFLEWPDAAFDLLVGGTPCQSFSVAGLRKGMADPRGNLALVYLAIVNRYRPKWFVWENVPGVLSSNGGRDFGSFLGGVQQLGYGFAYRVLDAQFVRVDGFNRAVPQRRRRVFVVGSLRGWRSAAAVLFERESLLWDSPPRRQTGQGTAADVAPSIVASGRGVERTGDTRGQDPVIAVPDVCGTLSDGAHMGGGLNGQDAYTGRIIPVRDLIAFSAKDHGGDATRNISPTLRAGGFTGSHANAGVMPAIAFNARQDPISREGGALPLDTDPATQAVAFDMRGRDGGSQLEGPHDTANLRAASGGSSRSYVTESWAVRRLTPTECERLQGYQDGYTNIPWRGKPDAPDGPRYKAIGNSKAVNVVRWLGGRIQMVDDLLSAA